MSALLIILLYDIFQYDRFYGRLFKPGRAYIATFTEQPS